MNKGITAARTGPPPIRIIHGRAIDLCTPNIMQSSACDESQAHNGARGPVSGREMTSSPTAKLRLSSPAPMLRRVINKSRCSVKLGRTYRGRPPPEMRRRSTLRSPPSSCPEGDACRRIQTLIHICSIVRMKRKCECIKRKNLCIARKGGTKVLSYGELIHNGEGPGHLALDS